MPFTDNVLIFERKIGFFPTHDKSFSKKKIISFPFQFKVFASNFIVCAFLSYVVNSRKKRRKHLGSRNKLMKINIFVHTNCCVVIKTLDHWISCFIFIYSVIGTDKCNKIFGSQCFSRVLVIPKSHQFMIVFTFIYRSHSQTNSLFHFFSQSNTKIMILSSTNCILKYLYWLMFCIFSLTPPHTHPHIKQNSLTKSQKETHKIHFTLFINTFWFLFWVFIAFFITPIDSCLHNLWRWKLKDICVVSAFWNLNWYTCFLVTLTLWTMR